jgi:hypothetical protein
VKAESKKLVIFRPGHEDEAVEALREMGLPMKGSKPIRKRLFGTKKRADRKRT